MYLTYYMLLAFERAIIVEDWQLTHSFKLLKFYIDYKYKKKKKIKKKTLWPGSVHRNEIRIKLVFYSLFRSLKVVGPKKIGMKITISHHSSRLIHLVKLMTHHSFVQFVFKILPIYFIFKNKIKDCKSQI